MTTSVDLDSSAIKMAQSRVGPKNQTPHMTLPRKIFIPRWEVFVRKNKKNLKKNFILAILKL